MMTWEATYWKSVIKSKAYNTHLAHIESYQNNKMVNPSSLEQNIMWVNFWERVSSA
jgi:ribosomal protein S11